MAREKEQKMAKCLGTYHPSGKSTRSSWLQYVIALTIKATWGINKRMEDLSVFLCLPLYRSFSLSLILSLPPSFFIMAIFQWRNKPYKKVIMGIGI